MPKIGQEGSSPDLPQIRLVKLAGKAVCAHTRIYSLVDSVSSVSLAPYTHSGMHHNEGKISYCMLHTYVHTCLKTRFPTMYGLGLAAVLVLCRPTLR